MIKKLKRFFKKFYKELQEWGDAASWAKRR